MSRWLITASGFLALGLAALTFVLLFDVQGLERNILLLAAVLPPAVINVMFAQRYQASPRAVSSAPSH